MKKSYIKTNIIGFVIAVVIVSGVAVYAAVTFPSKDVTYENGTSGLESNNVQGAIDELYIECTKEPTTGEQLLDKIKIVTSGDGLYEDEYEEGKYTYKGANPNNYITFNGEEAGWRIISVNSDGTIKIMKNGSLGSQHWDTAGKNTWSTASLNIYLNDTYYNTLTENAKKQISRHSFGVGAVSEMDKDLANSISNENSVKWDGNIGLISATEFIRAISEDKNKCGNMELIEQDSWGTCSTLNWMYQMQIKMKLYDFWTITPRIGSSIDVFYTYNTGYLYYYTNNVNPTISTFCCPSSLPIIKYQNHRRRWFRV